MPEGRREVQVKNGQELERGVSGVTGKTENLYGSNQSGGSETGTTRATDIVRKGSRSVRKKYIPIQISIGGVFPEVTGGVDSLSTS